MAIHLRPVGDEPNEEREIIEAFLRRAQDRLAKERAPFPTVQGNMVIAWLRMLLERTPSQMEGDRDDARS